MKKKIAIGNELDWPMMSAFTGFTNNCWRNGPVSYVEGVEVDSIYARLGTENI